MRLWQGQPGDPAVRNVWGTALNENDNLLEAGILGTVLVNIAGLTTYTLQTANGATDQAREYIQSYTGLLTANCTVTLPPVPKIGWAQNNTTGGFSVVLTTGGTGTTATIPADGTYYWYMVDGLGNVTLPTFTFANSSVDTLTVNGNATIGGTLGVTGATTLSTLAVTGNETVGGTLGVTGNTTVGGTLAVAGATTLASLGVTANASVGGSLSVTGSVNSTATIQGQNLTVLADAAIDGNAVVGGTLAVTGDTTLNGGSTSVANLNVTTEATISAPMTVTGAFIATANATLDGGLTSIANLNITSSGTYGGIAALVYNSGTWTISITGNAGTATTASLASSVPWTGVTGVPSLCYNDGGTYGINITGNANYASSAGAVAWNTITGKPYAFNQSTDIGSSPVFATLETTGGVTSSGNGCWVQEANVATVPTAWTVALGIVASGAGMNAAGFYASSDERIKDRIVDISAEQAIGWIKAGRPRHYWKEGHPEAGFVAQEEMENGRGESIIQVPDSRELFSEGDGFAEPGHRLSKNYEHEVAYLTRALQDALARIEALEERLRAGW